MSPTTRVQPSHPARRAWLRRCLRAVSGLAMTLATPLARGGAAAAPSAAAAPASAPSTATATSAGWARPWNELAFAARGEDATLTALGWTGPARAHAGILLTAPEIAESGAVVPVEVRSSVPGTRRIALLVLDNPNTLAADFLLGPRLLPRISTRLKLADTTTVVALVEADGRIYSARQLVKVTVGGCGG